MSPTGGNGPRRGRSRSRSVEPKNSKIRKKLGSNFSSTSNDTGMNQHQHNSKNLITVPTNNLYEQLADDVVDPEIVNNNINKPAARPPPLCVFNLKINEVTSKIKEVISDPKNVRIRMTQHGTKIFVESTEQFKMLKELFEKEKVSFYTHSLPSERTTKFVVYGLLQVTATSLISSALAEIGLVPTAVKKLSVKNPRYHDQATVLLYFKQSDKVTLSKLQQVKAIDHLVVSFRQYSRNMVGPTQCANCLHFGHGKQNCNLLSRCVRCGGNHAASKCDLILNKADPRSKIPQDKVKCANCGGPHTANFNRCPARVHFIQMKQTIQQKRTTKLRPQIYHPIHDPAPVQSRRQPGSWADIVASSKPSKGNDQLSPEECMEVFDYFTTLYDQGLTVQQQIRAIAQFTFTFMYKRTQHVASR